MQAVARKPCVQARSKPFAWYERVNVRCRLTPQEARATAFGRLGRGLRRAAAGLEDDDLGLVGERVWRDLRLGLPDRLSRHLVQELIGGAEVG